MNYLSTFVRNATNRNSTKQGYLSTLLRYKSFHNCTIEFLLKELNEDEQNIIYFKERCLKQRLLTYRNHLLEHDFQ